MKPVAQQWRTDWDEEQHETTNKLKALVTTPVVVIVVLINCGSRSTGEGRVQKYAHGQKYESG